ncbi:hypothetical protein [Bartonella harrusi]|uniref:Uncharacterized protein n=1 Tax=Bartonella harrusi TaxID=2961895 RepID=A0ABY5EUE4_9HYPH|nr:hypothetical protein [Bartonella harrusi]UTO28108.1 hypothetical protein NMK50_07910 [Bartonella harrusi]
MGLGTLRDVSLKQARECATQWRFVLLSTHRHFENCPVLPSKVSKSASARDF